MNTMVYFCLFAFVVFIGWAILDDESGCLRVGLFYIVVILILMVVFSLKRCYQNPEFDNRKTVMEPHCTIYRFSHSQYRCPNGLTRYCVEKSDTIAPTRNDICVHCGTFFRKHQYEKTKEEQELDEQFWQRVAETPTE